MRNELSVASLGVAPVMEERQRRYYVFFSNQDVCYGQQSGDLYLGFGTNLPKNASSSLGWDFGCDLAGELVMAGLMVYWNGDPACRMRVALPDGGRRDADWIMNVPVDELHLQ
ncbi:MAG: hypothetical protein EOO38_14275 [Cytophagaceae bacterium]|nr:MAG: hypothetical protein EOO38_14275 [Cytophagaceae bacterium]